ncbi:hypothetical protein H6F98_14735 [Microcoleus sp. FACHB-SPT15]|uniref:hypothetical protein n=1 Tax=Microcoleus sp. FACHB-SPT15 TaxID=2692830 RepID=UPI00177FEC3F|nr:hypothetical protein [Microcoleus sp. FACHB-SPT15]MBD1806702.1 hypothetical protein [Microcoleus sp. FACHB-SPT15]
MIHYELKPLNLGYRLTVWESAPITPSRVEPFHFKLNFTIVSLKEAQNILNLIPGEKANALSPSSSE